MNVEIGTVAPIFLFWEYLFRNIGILSLQCGFLAVDSGPAVADVQAVAAPMLLQSVSAVISPIMLLGVHAL
jgi:hypothetical protein